MYPKLSLRLSTYPQYVFTISDSGDPNREEFSKAVEALYSLSYAVRMSYKSENVPEGYYLYTVFPLEAIWWIIQNQLLTRVTLSIP